MLCCISAQTAEGLRVPLARLQQSSQDGVLDLTSVDIVGREAAAENEAPRGATQALHQILQHAKLDKSTVCTVSWEAFDLCSVAVFSPENQGRRRVAPSDVQRFLQDLLKAAGPAPAPRSQQDARPDILVAPSDVKTDIICDALDFWAKVSNRKTGALGALCDKAEARVKAQLQRAGSLVPSSASSSSGPGPVEIHVWLELLETAAAEERGMARVVRAALAHRQLSEVAALCAQAADAKAKARFDRFASALLRTLGTELCGRALEVQRSCLEALEAAGPIAHPRMDVAHAKRLAEALRDKLLEKLASMARERTFGGTAVVCDVIRALSRVGVDEEIEGEDDEDDEVPGAASLLAAGQGCAFQLVQTAILSTDPQAGKMRAHSTWRTHVLPLLLNFVTDNGAMQSGLSDDLIAILRQVAEKLRRGARAALRELGKRRDPKDAGRFACSAAVLRQATRDCRALGIPPPPPPPARDMTASSAEEDEAEGVLERVGAASDEDEYNLEPRLGSSPPGPTRSSPFAKARGSRQRLIEEEEGELEAHVREMFLRCDADGDGRINKRELIKICRSDPEVADFFGVPSQIRQEDGSRDRLEAVFQGIDTGDDRFITWPEFYNYFVARSDEASVGHHNSVRSTQILGTANAGPRFPSTASSARSSTRLSALGFAGSPSAGQLPFESQEESESYDPEAVEFLRSLYGEVQDMSSGCVSRRALFELLRAAPAFEKCFELPEDYFEMDGEEQDWQGAGKLTIVDFIDHLCDRKAHAELAGVSLKQLPSLEEAPEPIAATPSGEDQEPPQPMSSGSGIDSVKAPAQAVPAVSAPLGTASEEEVQYFIPAADAIPSNVGVAGRTAAQTAPLSRSTTSDGPEDDALAKFTRAEPAPVIAYQDPAAVPQKPVTHVASTSPASRLPLSWQDAPLGDTIDPREAVADRLPALRSPGTLHRMALGLELAPRVEAAGTSDLPSASSNASLETWGAGQALESLDAFFQPGLKVADPAPADERVAVGSSRASSKQQQDSTAGPTCSEPKTVPQGAGVPQTLRERMAALEEENAQLQHDVRSAQLLEANHHVLSAYDEAISAYKAQEESEDDVVAEMSKVLEDARAVQAARLDVGQAAQKASHELSGQQPANTSNHGAGAMHTGGSGSGLGSGSVSGAEAREEASFENSHHTHQSSADSLRRNPELSLSMPSAIDPPSGQLHQNPAAGELPRQESAIPEFQPEFEGRPLLQESRLPASQPDSGVRPALQQTWPRDLFNGPLVNITFGGHGDWTPGPSHALESSRTGAQGPTRRGPGPDAPCDLAPELSEGTRKEITEIGPMAGRLPPLPQPMFVQQPVPQQTQQTWQQQAYSGVAVPVPPAVPVAPSQALPNTTLQEALLAAVPAALQNILCAALSANAPHSAATLGKTPATALDNASMQSVATQCELPATVPAATSVPPRAAVPPRTHVEEEREQLGSEVRALAAELRSAGKSLASEVRAVCKQVQGAQSFMARQKNPISGGVLPELPPVSFPGPARYGGQVAGDGKEPCFTFSVPHGPPQLAKPCAAAFELDLEPHLQGRSCGPAMEWARRAATATPSTGQNLSAGVLHSSPLQWAPAPAFSGAALPTAAAFAPLPLPAPASTAQAAVLQEPWLRSQKLLGRRSASLPGSFEGRPHFAAYSQEPLQRGPILRPSNRSSAGPLSLSTPFEQQLGAIDERLRILDAQFLKIRG